MSEEKEEAKEPDPVSEENGSEETLPLALPVHDWFLQSLVNMANDGISMGITLTIGGTIISGTLISGREYFKEFGRTMAGAVKSASEQVRQDIENSFGAYAKLYDRPPSPSGPGFLHMKNARAVVGEIPHAKTLWRIRMTAVDGFFLGEMGFKTDE